MNKKRGILSVVLIVLVLFSFSVVAEVAWVKKTWLEIDVGNIDDDCEEWESNYNIERFQTSKNWRTLGCTSSNDLNKGFIYFPDEPLPESITHDQPDEGCVFAISEQDTWANDDCGYAEIYEGERVGIFARELNYYDLETTWDENDWRSGFDTCGTKWKSGNNYEYICKEDHYWYECNTAVNGEVLEINTGEEDPKVFICLLNSNKYKWIDLEAITGADFDDADEDLVPDILDCAPDNGWVYGEFACRMEEASDKTCITDAECSDLVEGTCKPNGKCESKICETIAATEICGDGIDNDCSEWDGEEPYDYTNAEDDCDQDQTACESNCLASEETCSWIDSETGNKCCGDDGITDLGLIQDGTADGQPDSYLCLNRNEELVGSSAGLNPWPDQTDTSPESPNPQRCQGDWCWVKAGAEAKFKIFTIKKPDQHPYDIVSNSQEWFACSAAAPDLAISVIDPTN